MRHRRLTTSRDTRAILGPVRPGTAAAQTRRTRTPGSRNIEEEQHASQILEYPVQPDPATPHDLGGCAPQPAGVVEKVVKETVVVEGEPVVVTATPEAPVQPGGTIIYSDFSDAETLNPILFSDDASDMVCQMIYNALVQLDEQGNVLPDLAERWEVSSDELTFTYYLRQDVTWHDGEPFTAADVKFTYEMILNEDVNSPRRADFVDLLEPENIVVLDDYTIQFTLNRIDAAWLCCKDVYMIIPEHILGGMAPADINTATFNTAPVGHRPVRLPRVGQGRSHRSGQEPGLFRGRAERRRLVLQGGGERDGLLLPVADRRGRYQHRDGGIVG